MKEEEIYTRWQNNRRQVDVPKGLSIAIMQQIKTHSDAMDTEFTGSLTRLPDRLAAWAAAGGLIFLGLFRLFFILGNLLRPYLLLN